jgi:Protein of unknown function (DUF2752)
VVAALGILGTFLLWRFDPRRLPLEACSFHAMTGLYCPGCGATRATHELLHGRLLAALHDNALWVVLLPLVAYEALSEFLRLARGRGLKYNLLRRPRVLVALAAAGLLFGVLRNLPVDPFVMFVPPHAPG